MLLCIFLARYESYELVSVFFLTSKWIRYGVPRLRRNGWETDSNEVNVPISDWPATYHD